MIFELEKEEKVKLIIKVDFVFTGGLSPIHNKTLYSGHNVFIETFLKEDGQEEFKIGDTKFRFYGSITKPIQEEEDIPSMLYCFISDAIAGSMEFEEFCQEFGYYPTKNTLYGEGKRQLEKAEFIYFQCKEFYDEFKNIYGAFSGIDPYSILEYLSENFSL